MKPSLGKIVRQMESAGFHWDKLPQTWAEAPFLGNGLLGAMIFQTAAHVLTLQINRADVYDQRDPQNT